MYNVLALYVCVHCHTYIGAAGDLVKGVKRAMEGPPGQVAPSQKMKTGHFAHFIFDGPLSGLGWTLSSLRWVIKDLKLARADPPWTPQCL